MLPVRSVLRRRPTVVLKRRWCAKLKSCSPGTIARARGAAVAGFDRVVVDGIVRAIGQMTELGAAGSTWAEKHLIYGGLNTIGYGNHLLAKQWRQLQSGMVHHYAAIIVAGLFLLAVVIQFIVQR